MTAFTIDKSVPIPDRRHGPSQKYPLREMKVGDSFMVPSASPEDYQRVRSAISQYGRRYTQKHTTRISAEGMRVWRIV